MVRRNGVFDIDTRDLIPQARIENWVNQIYLQYTNQIRLVEFAPWCNACRRYHIFQPDRCFQLAQHIQVLLGRNLHLEWPLWVPAEIVLQPKATSAKNVPCCTSHSRGCLCHIISICANWPDCSKIVVRLNMQSLCTNLQSLWTCFSTGSFGTIGYIS